MHFVRCLVDAPRAPCNAACEGAARPNPIASFDFAQLDALASQFHGYAQLTLMKKPLSIRRNNREICKSCLDTCLVLDKHKVIRSHSYIPPPTTDPCRLTPNLWPVRVKGT